MLLLNQNDCELLDDWYLQVLGEAGRALHQHENPVRRWDVVKDSLLNP